MRRPLCLAMLGFVAAVRIIKWVKQLPDASPAGGMGVGQGPPVRGCRG